MPDSQKSQKSLAPKTRRTSAIPEPTALSPSPKGRLLELKIESRIPVKSQPPGVRGQVSGVRSQGSVSVDATSEFVIRHSDFVIFPLPTAFCLLARSQQRPLFELLAEL